MFGFELFFATIRANLKSKNDLLVSILHFEYIKKGFLCVGTGEDYPETPEKGSELLPSGWNQSEDTYILRYVNPKSGQKLLIKAVKLSELLLISALIIGNNYASSHHIKTEDYITDAFNEFDRAFTSATVDSISQILQKEVIDKTLDKSDTNRNTRKRTPKTENDPLRVRQPTGPSPYDPNPYGPLGIENDPFQGGQWPPPIGGADLDPLGHGQGGMIMDPRFFPVPFGRPRNPAPGLPRGAIPPGARFDPFGPPGAVPNPRPNRHPRNVAPDPDNLPPPGYDDQFD